MSGCIGICPPSNRNLRYPAILTFLAGLLLAGFAGASESEDQTWHCDGPLNHISLAQIHQLPAGVSLDKIVERFGDPIKSSIRGGTWPREEGRGVDNEINQWRMGYWFFFERSERGRLKKPLTLQFVASLKETPEEPVPAMYDLMHLMTIDWPEADTGKTASSITSKSPDFVASRMFAFV